MFGKLLLYLALLAPASRPIELTVDTHPDPQLQAKLLEIDTSLRARFKMSEEQTSVGLVDLRTDRMAMIRPDRLDYAASVPKIIILLAWFETHPDPADLDAQTRRELELMIKQSSNELAAKYSRLIGLAEIETIIRKYGLYDEAHGGGLWLGKHYGSDSERIGDPLGDNSHAATVRQLLRFYLLLESGQLVSPEASKTMLEIFDAPEVAHRDDKFVKGLVGRDVQMLRKAGWWEDWFLDTALITGDARRYIIVAMTHHADGEDYLIALAPAVDDLMRND